MVFGVVTSDSDVMPSFIFWHSLTLNTETHIVPGGSNSWLEEEDGTMPHK